MNKINFMKNWIINVFLLSRCEEYTKKETGMEQTVSLITYYKTRDKLLHRF